MTTCDACQIAQRKHPSWLCKDHRRPGCHPVELADGSIEYPDLEELQAAGQLSVDQTLGNRRYVTPPTCSACHHRGETALLQRQNRDDPWVFRCGFCDFTFTETSPRSGRFTNGVYAPLWLLENER